MSELYYALSLKQPWATLLVHGRKTIEVRRWPTARRGRILIHAARLSDPRPEAWALLPDNLREAAQLIGGIIGGGDLTDCIAYRSRQAFQADQEHHLNNASWFRGPVLYGFVFTNLSALPFRRYPGWMRFFPVKLDEPRAKRRGSDRAAAPEKRGRGRPARLSSGGTGQLPFGDY
ncbi:MAG TPA: ASCH domain-containing protein [Gemmataceae bacterium]|nr:ASCH domain-containing protein [Gemmataceae bacterium]